jgi:lipopolysaccharide transport system permease protein
VSYQNFQDRNMPSPVRYLSELVKYRHLCANLVASDLRARFRRSRLGILWAVIQPLAFSLIVAAVWGTVFKQQSYLTFATYVFSGMLVWEYFSSSALTSLDAMILSQGYLKQARIPFFIFQLRTPLTGVVILFFGLIGLVLMLTVVQQWPPLNLSLLLVPLNLVFILMFMIPLCLLFSIIGTKFRDARYIVSIALQGLMFISPIMLTRELLNAPALQFLHYFNPLAPMLYMFRDPLLYGRLWNQTDVLVMTVWIAALWVIAGLASLRIGRRLVFAT